MTSVASSPHTTSFLLCASIVNGTPWARKKILDRNGLGSNFFFCCKRGQLGGFGMARPGKPGSPFSSPLYFPLYAKFWGSLVVKCKTLHGEELESPG